MPLIILSPPEARDKIRVMKTAFWVLALTSAILVNASSCAKTPNKEPSTKDWNDFVITDDSHLPNFANETNPNDCETKIRNAVCLVDPAPTGQKVQRNCDADSVKYQNPVVAVYKHLPTQFQKMFCTMKVIYIEKETLSIAYAGFAVSPTNASRSNFIGIRQSVLDLDLPLNEVLGWKEQKLFGANAEAYIRDPNLPLLTLKRSSNGSSTEVSPLLTYVLLHEMGHLFDYNNALTRQRCLNDSCTLTRLESDSWGYGTFDRQSKINLKSPLAPYRDKICFYDCRQPSLRPDQATDFYAALKKSEFLTAYSAESPYENFAEATANYFMKSVYGISLGVEIDGVEVYDIGSKYVSKPFAKTRRAVEKFYEGRIQYGW